VQYYNGFLSTVLVVIQCVDNEKSAQRDANTARALTLLRFGHRAPATNTQTHRQDRLQYKTVAKVHSSSS